MYSGFYASAPFRTGVFGRLATRTLVSALLHTSVKRLRELRSCWRERLRAAGRPRQPRRLLHLAGRCYQPATFCQAFPRAADTGEKCTPRSHRLLAAIYPLLPSSHRGSVYTKPSALLHSRRLSWVPRPGGPTPVLVFYWSTTTEHRWTNFNSLVSTA